MDLNVGFQRYLGSIIPDTFLSASQNVFLNFVTGLDTGILSDESGKLTLGETATIDGDDFIFRGSGTAQPGIDLLGLVVPLGLARDVLLFEEASTGNLYFVYPDGPPNILGAIALIIDIEEEGYNLVTSAPICFCRGTRIASPGGERPVETLRPGDTVLDSGGEELRILWTGHIRYEAPLQTLPPIAIEPGALGGGLPRRELRVSPWHRLPVPGMGGALPLLAPAKAMTDLRGIRQTRANGAVEYYHILTERHALVLAEGQPVETLLPGPMALRTMGHAEVERILDALGCDLDGLKDHPAAQPCGRLLTVAETRPLMRRIADHLAAAGSSLVPDPPSSSKAGPV